MNLHHLELFYHVARCGGISAAARGMSYGIQQPAISHQIGLLEKDLGVSLFDRRPFALTPAGRALYGFAASFFGHVEEVAAELRAGGRLNRLRIAASNAILRDHLPAPLRRIRDRFQPLAVSLSAHSAPVMLQMLARGEVDLVISALDARPPPGLRSTALVELLPSLAVRDDSPWRTARDLLARGAASETVIVLPSDEPVTRIINRGMERLGVHWRARLELDNFDLLFTYVAHGFGVGFTLMVPSPPPGVRLLPLKDFPRLGISAVWKGRLTPPATALLEELKTVGSKI